MNDDRLFIGKSLYSTWAFNILAIMQEREDSTGSHPKGFFEILPPRLQNNSQNGHPSRTLKTQKSP
jgi:hypothetical protein